MSFQNGSLTLDTAGIFATYPQPYLSVAGGLGDQVRKQIIANEMFSFNKLYHVAIQILGTMVLLLCICAITDKKNMHVPPSLAPMYVGFTILAIGACFGMNCGYAINPARDLSPRILTLISGWGTGVFR